MKDLAMGRKSHRFQCCAVGLGICSAVLPENAQLLQVHVDVQLKIYLLLLLL
jgi:hypothetical protein